MKTENMYYNQQKRSEVKEEARRLRRKFLRYQQAEIVYSLSHKKLMELANDHKKYVEQVTTYPTVTVHKSFFTDSQGYLILPKNLEIGHYRIEEVTAPDGYVVNKNYVEITVDSDTAYEVDGVSGDVIIEVSYEDQPVKGNLIVYAH